MKAFKITLAVLVVVILTLSVVSKNVVTKEDTNTYKEYSPKDKLVLRKKKRITVSQA